MLDEIKKKVYNFALCQKKNGAENVDVDPFCEWYNQQDEKYHSFICCCYAIFEQLCFGGIDKDTAQARYNAAVKRFEDYENAKRLLTAAQWAYENEV